MTVYDYVLLVGLCMKPKNATKKKTRLKSKVFSLERLKKDFGSEKSGKKICLENFWF